MNNHTASFQITVNVHVSVLSRKLRFWTSNWKHLIKYDLYIQFPRIVAHNVQIRAKFCCKNFSDVCQVFRILHIVILRGGGVFSWTRWAPECRKSSVANAVQHCQHTPTAALQKSQLPFSWAMAPQQSRSLTPLTMRVIISKELQVTRLNKWSQRLVEVWQCNSTGTSFEWKDAILSFFISPGSAEAL